LRRDFSVDRSIPVSANAGINQDRIIENAYKRLPATDKCQMSYAIVYRGLGREAEAQAMLPQVIEENHAFRDFGLATIYAQWGDNDRAFDSLRKSRSIEDLASWHVEYETLFRVVHDDPRRQSMIDEFWASYQSSGEADSSALSR
jgi:hypothetical protein